MRIGKQRKQKEKQQKSEQLNIHQNPKSKVVGSVEKSNRFAVLNKNGLSHTLNIYNDTLNNIISSNTITNLS